MLFVSRKATIGTAAAQEVNWSNHVATGTESGGGLTAS